MDLFAELAEVDPAERPARITAASGGDLLLERDVHALFASDEANKHDTVLAPGAGLKRLLTGQPGDLTRGLASSLTHPPAESRRGGIALLPQLAGRYRLLRVLGEGGMGTVYEAEQLSPRRLVALKSLRAGVTASDRAMRRFALEAEVLARLQHPGIAQVYEAGFGDEGGEGPAWIAMELVRGKPLVAAARERDLARDERLRLFLAVCDAVSYAHQRGVIHRDLKPANILLAEADERAVAESLPGRPKILDFGVARVAGDAWDAATALTDPGQLVGTLPYMSPEQLGGDADAVDVRSDVYALGVIFYELLAGRRPFEVGDRGLPEAMRLIKDEDPTVLGRIDPGLRGDLEAIAMKALAKDPKRRYQSVIALAADVAAHLRGEPVTARGDSAFYILSRRARRYRWPLTVAAIVVLALVVLVVRSTVEAQRQSRLAAAEAEATEKAEAARRQLANELAASQLEQARLLARSGSLTAAEAILRIRTSANEATGAIDLPLVWARRELAARHPRIMDWKPHETTIRGVAILGNGDRIVTTSEDGCLVISDRDGQPLVTADLGGPAGALDVAEEQGVVVVGTIAGTVEAFRLPDLEPMGRVMTVGRPIRAVSICGNMVASGGDGPLVKVTSLEGEERGELTVSRIVGRLAFVDEDRLLVGLYDGRLVDWNLLTGTNRILGRHLTGYISALSVDRERQLAYSGGEDRICRVWDLRTDLEAFNFDACNGSVREFYGDPRDGSFLAIGWWSLDRWDAAGRVRRRLATPPPGVNTAQFRPDLNLAVTGGSAGTAQLWSIDSLSGGTPAPPLDGRCTSSFSPDGTKLAVGDGVGVTLVIDPRSGEVLYRPPQHSARVRSLRFSPDGAYLATTGEDNVLWLSETTHGAPIARYVGVETPTPAALSFSPDGRQLVVTCRPVVARVLAVPNLAVLAEMPLGTNQPISVAWSPNGDRIVGTGRDRQVRLFDANGSLLRSRLFVVSPWTLSYSPDGRFIAMGTWGRTILVLDANTLQTVTSLHGASGLITQAAWVRAAADDPRSYIYASCADGGFRVWEVETERILFEFEPFRSSDATACDISADGSMLTITGAWGEAAAWDLRRWDTWAERRVDDVEPVQ